ncbi:MAG: class IV adenylate cyclase [bacterium]|nr:class IV adenylate cyclase [bacterium]
MEEIEVKFLDINVEATRDKLKNLGAEFQGEFLYKSKSYDYADKSLGANHAWVRLRDEGEKITLTYKQRRESENKLKDSGMKEIEVNVSDFASTDILLKEIGLVEKFYEEKKRTRYVLDGVECDIDQWPLIPPYIELEGESIEALQRVAEKLGFNWEEYHMCSAMQIFDKYGIDENSFSILTFEKQIKK